MVLSEVRLKGLKNSSLQKQNYYYQQERKTVSSNDEPAGMKIFSRNKGLQSLLGLWYPRDSPFDLEAFSDSDYASAAGDRKSTTGGSEYVAAASCCGQVITEKLSFLLIEYRVDNYAIYPRVDNYAIYPL
nr:copia protein [Tanacetum cinerariifolium]